MSDRSLLLLFGVRLEVSLVVVGENLLLANMDMPSCEY